MSYSGAGLYDDDAGADVRRGFRDYVADGLTGEAATDCLIADWGAALEEHDEACAFWLALADTQWRVGRLEDRVRTKALQLIDSGEDLARFDHDARLHTRRQAALEELSQRLLSPQRSPVRIRRPFRSLSPVQVGDVFELALSGNRTVLLRCVELNGDERDNYPTVEVLDGSVMGGSVGDISKLSARRSKPPRADLLQLIRYASDPDPIDRIRIIATGTTHNRRRTLPAELVAWTDVEDRIDDNFGPA